MTPDEGQNGDEVVNGLGSLSPSAFSPGTMIQQLMTTPGGTAWATNIVSEAAVMGQLGGQPVRRATVVAQPTA